VDQRVLLESGHPLDAEQWTEPLKSPTLRRVPWRYLTVRYAWIALTTEALRSDRWSEDQKAEILFWSGAVISIPFTLCQIFWLLTGRGPLEWLYRPTVAFVSPFPRWRPTDPRGSIERQMQARSERYGDVPLVVPSPKESGSRRPGVRRPRWPISTGCSLGRSTLA
jgi:hypothetical protein